MRSFLAILFFSACLQASGQTVWENHNSPIYGYLSRMAQKGHIELNDVILPISRVRILEHLDTIQTKQLSSIERKELVFYLQEFNSSRSALVPRSQPSASRPAQAVSTSSLVPRPQSQAVPSSHSIFKKDSYKRFRAISVNNPDFKLMIDPILGYKQVVGNEMSYREVSNGVNMWGQAKRFGFQMYYRDYTLTGDGLNNINNENPGTTIIDLINRDPNKKNHNEIKGHLSYSWKNGSVSLGKDHLLMGYGESGKIILSDRAPSFPYLRFDYNPIKWLHFNYSHAWLNSNIVDSARTYGTGTSGVSGDIRVRYRSKFLVTHSLTVLPLKGLSITLGESMVYSDKLDVGFFIPIIYFKAYDNNRSNYLINAGSNGQLFLQLSSRNHIKKTHLYTNIFIDELSVTKVFDKMKSRNQLGVLLGASVTDVFLPYLTFGAEYTRINPFVYRNLIPAQEYVHYNQELGDWMGNNFDRVALMAKYNPVAKLRLDLRVQKIRKGGAGTLVQQYQAEPQPAFLFDYQKNRTDIVFNAQYEWLNNFYIFTSYQHQTKKPVNALMQSNRLFTVGMSYGL